MRVLVLCTGNSARSQMAEGLIRHLAGGRVEVHSAGTAPAGLHPLAVRAMGEIGIDISHHRSKSLREFWGQPFDLVLTVCDAANEACPTFPGASERRHYGVDDPAAAIGSEDARLQAFRRARDVLHGVIERLLRERNLLGVEDRGADRQGADTRE
ncbi:MAG: arsenate reductase ArsC [Armatimonadetes bacterium]|nr:arsenate reductase ArsC [Armatimonadota bacterium]